MNGNFYALMFRMKHINRWSLMRSAREENLSEHSLECCFLAHALAVIGNRLFNKSYNPELIALKAAYHDAAEIITGDMPTPVKYYNQSIKSAYETIESDAISGLTALLPPELQGDYKHLFEYTTDEKRLIKAADTLCAYIKCLDEEAAGNREFTSAKQGLYAKIQAMDCQELNYFMTNCVQAFQKNLDELKYK